LHFWVEKNFNNPDRNRENTQERTMKTQVARFERAHPKTVETVARGRIIGIPLSDIPSGDLPAWGNVFAQAERVALTDTEEPTVLVTLNRDIGRDVWRDLIGRDAIEIYGLNTMRLPYGNLGAFAQLSRAFQRPEVLSVEGI